ncbi:MAG: LysR family transcriptional regulator [Clostridia bacterium]|nr:LysR family transcriptional regulator [Clostridia bacterium]
MEIRDLRFFCTTAEMEHVTKAADKLCISQPFLTKVIGQIEQEIGAELFDKVGRRIRLNRSGEVFYAHAKKILADLDDLFTEMDYELERKERSITLLCNTEAYASRLVESFNRTNPVYSLTVKYMSSQDIIKALCSGEADFALCSPPIGDGVYPNLKTEVALKDLGCILLPPGHPLLKKDQITLSDLSGMPINANLKGGAMRSKLDVVFKAHNFHPRVCFESYSVDMIIRSVLGGRGYAVVTWLLVEDYPEIKKYCRDVKDVDIRDKVGSFGLTYSTVGCENRYVKEFRDFTQEFLSNLQSTLKLPKNA